MYRKPKNDRYGFFRIILAFVFVIPSGIVALPASPGWAGPATAPDGPGVWTSDGPYGGNIQDITFSPGFAADRTVFVATTQGVFKSTNGGDSWIKASQGLSPAHVTALAIAPDSTLFAGTAGGGVFKSVDGGASWAATNTGMSDLDIHTLAVAPTYPLTPTLLAEAMGTRLLYSGDGGARWESGGYIDNLDNSPTPRINAIVFSPDYANDATVWVGTATGLWRSNHSAQEWVRPSKRYNHSAIYDTANARMIVFGGCNDYGRFLNDVWALELSATGAKIWTEIHPQGTPPSARHNHSAIYDAANERMIVFGGFGGGYFHDIWSLDLSTPGGETWIQLSPLGSLPAARLGHSAIYDEANERMVVFGGQGADGKTLNAVWALSLSLSAPGAWTQLTPSGTLPTAREFHSAIYDAPNARMVVFGGNGVDYNNFNLVWTLSLHTPGAEAWTQLNPPGPPPLGRFGHGAIYDTANARMIVFGGYGSEALNSIWTLDLHAPGTETWTQLSPSGAFPSGICNHSTIYDAANKQMIIFGGGNDAGLDDLWALNLDGAPGAESWSRRDPPKALPVWLSGHSAIYDAPNARMIAFGGIEYGEKKINDVWVLDLRTPGAETWRRLTPSGTLPVARHSHSAIYDAANQRMIVFGGCDGGHGEMNDIWALNLSVPGGETWTQLTPSGTLPAIRCEHSAIYDAANERMIVFGGYDGDFRKLNDIWELDLSTPGAETWRQLNPPGSLPAARSKHSAIYDAANERMIVFGGEGNFGDDDNLWALDLSLPGAETWTQRTSAGPLPLAYYGHSAVYDAANERMVIFGGEGGEISSETWSLDLSTPGSETWTHFNPPETPPGLGSHSAIYDAAGERMIVTGGEYNFYNDIWALDLSTSEQSHWIVPNRVESIAVSPSYTADGVLWIATPTGVLQSQDSGESWMLKNAGIPAGVTVKTLALSPHYPEDHTIFAGAGTGIYRSTNDGMTWTAVNNGLETLDVQALAFSPTYRDDRTLFVGTWNNLYRSPNRGEGWVTANLGLIAVNVRQIAISSGFSNDHTVFAAGETGIYKSTASGALWTGVNNGLITPQTYDIALSPAYPGDQTLFAATAAGVFRSGDGGGWWTGFNSGLEAGNVKRLALSPQFATDRDLFAIVDDGKGIQRSTDAGGSWSLPELRGLATNAIALSPDFGADRRAWAATQRGWLTTDGDHTWQGWPVSRNSPSAIYDAANARMIVFGGLAPDYEDLNDIWALDLGATGSATWTLLNPLGTPPQTRYIYGAIYDAANQRMLLFGRKGVNYEFSYKVWALDLSAPGAEAWTQLNPLGTGPFGDAGYDVIYDAANARMIVISESGDSVFALDLNAPGAETWTRLSLPGTLPGLYSDYSTIYDAANARVIVSGGFDVTHHNVWALDLSTPGAGVWAKLNPSGMPPLGRYDHSAIYDAANERMIIFGGHGNGLLGDVWSLDLSTPGAETWTQISPSGVSPSARYEHSAIYDAANERMIIFGGRDDPSFGFGDLWAFNLQAAHSWTQLPTDTTILDSQDYFSDQAISLIAASPGFNADHTLFLVSDDRLYHTADAGATWELRASLPGITDLLLSPVYSADHTLYAVASGDVYQSTDEGVTWTALSAGLGANTLNIAYDGQSKTLFAAAGSGVWRYTFPQPKNVLTLILTHQGRMRDRYGAATTDLLETLYALAGHPEVSGLVVDLGDAAAYPEVAAAYAAWDASSPSGTLFLGDTALANRVALAVRDVITAQVAAYPNLHYLVLVGHDEIIPFHRLPDGTAAEALPYAGYAPITGTVALALAEGMTLSDDPYASLHPLTLSDGSPLYVPDLAAGRLVESPGEISAAIDAFLLRSEVNDHALAFVSGADYALMDGAFAIADTLRAGNLATAELIGNDWSASDLALTLLAQEHDLVSLNQHAYHDKLLAPDNTSITPQDVLSATADLQQTLVYATGCHAGLSLPDAPNHGLASNGGLDFPQAFTRRGAPLLANTGYGWATRYAVGLSERLALYFSQALAHSPGSTTTIGQALRDAKRRYYLAAWRFDAYDAKVLNEMTLYGLPMYSFSTPLAPARAADAAAQPAAAVTITYTTADPQALLQPANSAIRVTYTTAATLPPSITQANIQFRFPEENYNISEVGEARYYSYLGEVQANRGMPLLPRFSFGVGIPGAQTQGVLFIGGVYSDVFAQPLTTTVVISESLGEDLSSDYVPGQWYPTVLQLVNQLADGGDDQLTMSLGKMRQGIGPGGEELTPTQRLYNNVVFEVYYYNRAAGVPDRTPPVITSVMTDVVADTVRVSVAAEDVPGAGDIQTLGVWRVMVAYTLNTSGVGQWESQELVYNPATQRWEGDLPCAPQNEAPMLLIVQAVDRGGNVIADDHAGWYYQVPAIAASLYRIYLPLVVKSSN